MAEVDVWPSLIEKLKVQGEYASYSEMARDLKISPLKISAARSGQRELSSEMKAEILKRLDEPISQSIYESIFPEGSRALVRKHLSEKFHPDDDNEVRGNFWKRCLNDLKRRTNIEDDLECEEPEDTKDQLDSQIASALGVTNAEISGIKNGTRAATIPTKLKLLDAAGYMATRDVLLDLLPRKAALKFKKWDNLRFQKIEN